MRAKETENEPLVGKAINPRSPCAERNDDAMEYQSPKWARPTEGQTFALSIFFARTTFLICSADRVKSVQKNIRTMTTVIGIAISQYLG